MAEVLTIYTASFWHWAGITIGIGILVQGIVKLIVGVAVGIGGGNVYFHDPD